MLKYLIIVFFISISLTQTSNNKNKKYQNLKPNSIDIWENENKEIKNPQLKKELIKLNEDFQNKREKIKNNFEKKIKPLKIKKTNEISKLKDEYLKKREILFKKYRVETDFQLKKNNKDTTKNKNLLPYYKKHKPIPPK